MISSVPTTQVPTLYSRVGEVLPWGGLLVVLAGVATAVARRRKQAR